MFNKTKSKKSTETILIILRDFFSILVSFLLTDKIIEAHNKLERYEILVYLGVLLLLTAIVQIVKVIIKGYIKK